MAQSDNTLGAPTEGLGQTITFAFNPNNAPVQRTGSPGSVNARVEGGTVNPGSTSFEMPKVPRPNPFLDKVVSLASDHTKAEIRRKQETAFFSGQQRAAGGEAVSDIIKEQPWYSQLFGPSDVVEGARAYASSSVASNAMATMVENMPELRTKSPQEVQGMFNQMVDGAKTGDDVTDSQILTQFTKGAPSLFKQHAKEHYGWLQEQMVTQQGADWRAAARGLQAAGPGYAGQSVSEEDYAALKGDMEMRLLPAPGQEPKKYAASVADFLAEQGRMGNLHVLNALRGKEGEPSVFDVLTPDQQVAVHQAADRGETELRKKFSYAWSDRLSGIQVRATVPQPRWSGEQTGAEIDALNEEYMRSTGASSGLITPEQRAALTSGSAEKIVREQQRQAEILQHQRERAADKAAAAKADSQLDSVVVLSMNSGTISQLIGAPGTKAEDINYKVAKYLSSLQDPKTPGVISDAQVKVMRDAGKYVNPNMQQNLQSRLLVATASDEYTASAKAEVLNFARLDAASPDTANAYYGEKAGKLRQFRDDAILVGEQEAYRMYKMPHRPGVADDKEAAAAAKAVGSSFLGRLFTGVEGASVLAPGQDRRLAAVVGPMRDSLRQTNGVTMQDATAQAFKAKEAAGEVEILGGYVLTPAGHKTSASQELLQTGTLGIGTDNIHSVFRAAVEGAIIEKSGNTAKASDADSIQVTRLNTPEPSFEIRTVFADGSKYNTIMRQSDMIRLTQHTKARKTALEKTPPEGTGPGFFVNPYQRK